MSETVDDETGSHVDVPSEGPVTFSVRDPHDLESGRVLGPVLPAVEGGLGGRYTIEGEIAHGGIGVVFHGRDSILGRELAVKVLLPEHADRADMRRRFVEEAQIAGQLQHPGVVPVYEMGRFADGRPFIAMKLVKGRTLAALLRERTDPTHERPRFLSIFAQVCQTLAYSHARGVIHRDLKPSNIMVGGFGEVLVMDWGLAKVLASDGESRSAPGPSPETVVRTTGADGAATREGTVAGTPAYMSPEQALGEADRIDERADVFGLGAILCEILTGEPPYGVGPSDAVLRLARRADLNDALTRLDECGADLDLIALAHHCLAAEPEDRPRDARSVAAALTEHLTGVEERLRAAEIERAAAEAAGAGERRARRLTAGLAAAILLLAAGGAAAGWWLTRLRAEAERQFNVAIGEARGLRDQKKWPEAAAAVHRAEELAAGPSATADQRQTAAKFAADLTAQTAAADRDQRLLDRLVEIRAERAGAAHSAFLMDVPSAGAAAEYARAFRDYGIDIEKNPPAAVAAAIVARPDMVGPLTAALDDWALESIRRYRLLNSIFPPNQQPWQNLIEVAMLADPDPRRTSLREALRGRPLEGDALHEMARPESVAELPPATAQLLAAALVREGDASAALAALREAQRLHPGDLWLNFELAQAFESQGDDDQAARFYTAARAIRPEVGHALAHVLQRQGRDEAAVALFREIVALRPDNPSHLVCLAAALFDEREYDEATAACRRALDVKSAWSIPHLLLGEILMARGDFSAAEMEFRHPLDDSPGDWMGYDELGRAIAAQGRFADAAAAFGQALSRLQTARPLNRQTTELQRSEIERIQRQQQDAERLAKLDTRLPALLRGEDRPADADERLAVARLLATRNRHGEAARWFVDAFAADPKLGEPPSNNRFAAACSATQAGTGRTLDAAGADAEARSRWRRQALDWLRVDLKQWEQRTENGKPVDRTAVRHFLQDLLRDRALAGVRDDALDDLPERQDWHEFWLEVNTLLAAVTGKD